MGLSNVASGKLPSHTSVHIYLFCHMFKGYARYTLSYYQYLGLSIRKLRDSKFDSLYRNYYSEYAFVLPGFAAW